MDGTQGLAFFLCGFLSRSFWYYVPVGVSYFIVLSEWPEAGRVFTSLLYLLFLAHGAILYKQLMRVLPLDRIMGWAQDKQSLDESPMEKAISLVNQLANEYRQKAKSPLPFIKIANERIASSKEEEKAASQVIEEIRQARASKQAEVKAS